MCVCVYVCVCVCMCVCSTVALLEEGSILAMFVSACPNVIGALSWPITESSSSFIIAFHHIPVAMQTSSNNCFDTANICQIVNKFSNGYFLLLQIAFQIVFFTLYLKIGIYKCIHFSQQKQIIKNTVERETNNSSLQN